MSLYFGTRAAHFFFICDRWYGTGSWYNEAGTAEGAGTAVVKRSWYSSEAGTTEAGTAKELVQQGGLYSWYSKGAGTAVWFIYLCTAELVAVAVYVIIWLSRKRKLQA